MALVTVFINTVLEECYFHNHTFHFSSSLIKQSVSESHATVLNSVVVLKNLAFIFDWDYCTHFKQCSSEVEPLFILWLKAPPPAKMKSSGRGRKGDGDLNSIASNLQPFAAFLDCKRSTAVGLRMPLLWLLFFDLFFSFRVLSVMMMIENKSYQS